METFPPLTPGPCRAVSVVGEGLPPFPGYWPALEPSTFSGPLLNFSGARREVIPPPLPQAPLLLSPSPGGSERSFSHYCGY